MVLLYIDNTYVLTNNTDLVWQSFQSIKMSAFRYSETGLNQTLNKLSCINQTLNKVPVLEILVNLTYIHLSIQNTKDGGPKGVLFRQASLYIHYLYLTVNYNQSNIQKKLLVTSNKYSIYRLIILWILPGSKTGFDLESACLNFDFFFFLLDFSTT